MKTAVIFDSAGTLLKVYRVAKDVRKGLIVENVASTNIVTLRQGCALVALKVDTFDFLDGLSPGMALSSYIGQANVGMDVICRSHCTTERIAIATMGDTLATIGDMQDAIAAVKLKCKDIYYVNMGFIVDVPHATIPYVLATGGRIFRRKADDRSASHVRHRRVHLFGGQSQVALYSGRRAWHP
jgi:Cu+-exporting ATPase